MTRDELIIEINRLQTAKEEKEKELAETKKSIEGFSILVDSYKNELMKSLKEEHLDTYSYNGLKTGIFVRKSPEYKDEKAILEWLKANNQQNFIKTKITENIDKNAFKKEFKINESFQTNLKDYIGTKETEYVVVTTEANYEEMIRYMTSGK